MTSEKGVIRIIKQALTTDEYDEHYYFTKMTFDSNGNLSCQISGNIWEATKFNYVYVNNDEWCRISKLIEFIEACFLPKKNYVIEFIPITLNY